MLCENVRLQLLSQLAQETAREQILLLLRNFNYLSKLRNYSSRPLQIVKFTWPPLLRICSASLNTHYEGCLWSWLGNSIKLKSHMFS